MQDTPSAHTVAEALFALLEEHEALASAVMAPAGEAAVRARSVLRRAKQPGLDCAACWEPNPDPVRVATLRGILLVCRRCLLAFGAQDLGTEFPRRLQAMEDGFLRDTQLIMEWVHRVGFPVFRLGSDQRTADLMLRMALPSRAIARGTAKYGVAISLAEGRTLRSVVAELPKLPRLEHGK